MNIGGGASPGDGGTHGFLFADLRGYTELVETRGAADASRVLERYRAIVREVVARDGGAEIKTEGDSFYVVLPSASAALRCGLDILVACAQPVDGSEPIAVGVGIHAGESVAHEGGFVSSAVNIAARICALAGPGELLASGTIRELTRSIVSAQFVSFGRRQLKGLAEPVELFEVLPEGAVLPGRRHPREATSDVRPIRLLAVAAVAIVVVGAAIVALRGPVPGLSGAGSSESATASPGPTSSQLGASPSDVLARLPALSANARIRGFGFGGNHQPVPVGTYAPNVNRDVASVTVSDPDSPWWLAADTEDLLFFGAYTSAPAGSLSSQVGVVIARISVVYTGPCRSDATKLIGDRPTDVISWVQSTPQFDAYGPRSVIDLGRSGISIEATVRRPPIGECAEGNGSSVWLFGISGGSWSPDASTRMLFEALDDGAGTITVVFATATDDADILRSLATGLGRRLVDGIVLRP
jgi:class 3 adenylate cyclase